MNLDGHVTTSGQSLLLALGSPLSEGSILPLCGGLLTAQELILGHVQRSAFLQGSGEGESAVCLLLGELNFVVSGRGKSCTPPPSPTAWIPQMFVLPCKMLCHAA
jgi:hypothetical protein